MWTPTRRVQRDPESLGPRAMHRHWLELTEEPYSSFPATTYGLEKLPAGETVLSSVSQVPLGLLLMRFLHAPRALPWFRSSTIDTVTEPIIKKVRTIRKGLPSE